METILHLDQQLFLLVNHLPHVGVTDLFALFLSGIGMFGIIWLLLGAYLVFREEKRDHWFFVPLTTAVVISLTIVEILKRIVARPRPTMNIGAFIIGPPATDFSFPSGHTTVAWTMAVVLSAKEPKLKWLFYLLAALISLSRIYLGKHYPVDVVGGVILGVGIGIWIRIAFRLHTPYEKSSKRLK